jgi:dUTP pyrophosphatase
MTEAETTKKLPSIYKRGDRIGQLMVLPYPIIEPKFVETLLDAERGAGGFGSTGN